jgi:hypothetical protein
MMVISIPTAVATGHALVCSGHVRSFSFADHALARLHEAWRHDPLLVGLGALACMLVILFLRKL